MQPRVMFCDFLWAPQCLRAWGLHCGGSATPRPVVEKYLWEFFEPQTLMCVTAFCMGYKNDRSDELKNKPPELVFQSRD